MDVSRGLKPPWLFSGRASAWVKNYPRDAPDETPVTPRIPPVFGVIFPGAPQ